MEWICAKCGKLQKRQYINNMKLWWQFATIWNDWLVYVNSLSVCNLHTCDSREYWMIYRVPARIFWGIGGLFGSSPSPFPSSCHQLYLFISLPVFRLSRWLTGEGRGAWSRSRIIWPRESLALYKPFNTLWATGSTISSTQLTDPHQHPPHHPASISWHPKSAMYFRYSLV